MIELGEALCCFFSGCFPTVLGIHYDKKGVGGVVKSLLCDILEGIGPCNYSDSKHDTSQLATVFTVYSMNCDLETETAWIQELNKC